MSNPGAPEDAHAAALPVVAQGPAPRYAVQPSSGESITSLATGNTYTIESRIGEGHFGVVYSCFDVWNNDLAVKVLKPNGSYDKVRDAATAEFQKLLALRHPFVTFIHDAFEYRDTFYIVTERCFKPLSGLYEGRSDFNGSVWIKPVARCLLQAVNYLHLNGVAHQDIHSGNVFSSFVKDEILPKDHSALLFKVGDLGVARVFSELSPANTRGQWMLPPEVLDGAEFGPLDKRIDIYHCGMLLLSLLQGRELRFTTEEILAGKPGEMALVLEVPYRFALEKALRRHVHYRTADAMEFWRDLNTPEEGI